MLVCGIDLSASEAILVVLRGTRADFSVVRASPRRLPLTDSEDSSEVRAFRDAAHAFLRENGIELAAIKKRSTRGQFAGGPVSFKLEGIVQLYEGCPVRLLSPATIAATRRSFDLNLPADLFQYQLTAFEAAFTALPKG